MTVLVEAVNVVIVVFYSYHGKFRGHCILVDSTSRCFGGCLKAF